mgnify:FL=1
MKKTIFTILFILSVTINGMAQMTYKDGKLTVGRGIYKTYTTSWAGWAHYWGSTDQNGIKMHIHAADPRMSTTTNKLVFLDSDRSMYIDLYCRTLYQTSDEKLKTNIRSLKTIPVSRSTFSINIAPVQSNPSTNMVLKLNPVKYHWRDESEYERFNIRPVQSGVEEYGFLAQELEAVIPGAVAMTKEGDRLVNYSALIPILTAAIQELTARVAALESQLKAAGK